MNALYIAIAVYTLVGLAFVIHRQREIILINPSAFLAPFFGWPVWMFWTRRGFDAMAEEYDLNRLMPKVWDRIQNKFLEAEAAGQKVLEVRMHPSLYSKLTQWFFSKDGGGVDYHDSSLQPTGAVYPERVGPVAVLWGAKVIVDPASGEKDVSFRVELADEEQSQQNEQAARPEQPPQEEAPHWVDDKRVEEDGRCRNLLMAHLGVTGKMVTERVLIDVADQILSENLQGQIQKDLRDIEDQHGHRPDRIVMTKEMWRFIEESHQYNWMIGCLDYNKPVEEQEKTLDGLKVVIEDEVENGPWAYRYEAPEEEETEEADFSYTEEDITFFSGGVNNVLHWSDAPKTREELTQNMIAWFEDTARSGSYDAYAVTDLSVKPEDWHGDFIRAPFPAENKAFWGFPFYSDMEVFVDTFEEEGAAKGASLDDITRLHTL